MARILAFNIFTISTLIFFFTIPFTYSQEEEYDFVKTIDDKEIIKPMKKEKLSHLRFFWHDMQSGQNPSSIRVVESPTKLPNDFGFVNMIDNPLTVGPEPSSKIVGRAQGLYASASQEDLALLITMNFVFIEGEYNGSCVTLLGRNPVFNKVREMPVIGGSGLFRFARGYAQAQTYWFDQKAGDAIVEYNIYVLHY